MSSPCIKTFEEAQKCAFLHESWAYVPDFCGLFPGQYIISNLGRVLNLKTGNILHPWQNGSGYHLVSVTSFDGSFITETVHALVAATFIGKRPEGAVIMHLNGLPLDNRIENLAYGTCRQNVLDALRQNRYPSQLAPEEVLAIREMHKAGMPDAMIAERIGCTTQSVNNVVSGKRWGWFEAD